MKIHEIKYRNINYQTHNLQYKKISVQKMLFAHFFFAKLAVNWKIIFDGCDLFDSIFPVTSTHAEAW